MGPSGLSVGGLIKHCATVEGAWMDTVEQRAGGSEQDYENGFRLLADETLQDARARLDAAARAHGVRRGARAADLGVPVPVPQGVPWFPDDVEAWSIRWVLLHLIQETARHVGHADMVREAIDGATAFPLMAAAEGWPATPWMQPWTPPADSR